MPAEPGRFLLVVLHEDLAAHRTTLGGIWAQLRLISGIKSITDISVIDRATLDMLCLDPTPALKRASPTMFQACRRYWQRQRQPEML